MEGHESIQQRYEVHIQGIHRRLSVAGVRGERNGEELML